LRFCPTTRPTSSNAPGPGNPDPLDREVLAALRTPIVEIEGEEADDIIATLAVRSARTESDVCIASPDKDFMQIVSPRIRLIRPNGKEAVFMDESGVKSRYGVLPGQMLIS